MCRIFYLYLSTLIMKNFKNVPNLCSKVVWDSVCCSAGECQGCARLGSVSRSPNRYVNKHERKRKQPVSLQRREFFSISDRFYIGYYLLFAFLYWKTYFCFEYICIRAYHPFQNEFSRHDIVFFSITKWNRQFSLFEDEAHSLLKIVTTN